MHVTRAHKDHDRFAAMKATKKRVITLRKIPNYGRKYTKVDLYSLSDGMMTKTYTIAHRKAARYCDCSLKKKANRIPNNAMRILL